VKPCIIFIDEFDSVAVRRKDAASTDIQGNEEQVATINQLLTEMDGFGANSGVMVFAATNRPHVIDPALIRPGRFDRIIEMPLPNRASRADIIDLHCSYKQYQVGPATHCGATPRHATPAMSARRLPVISPNAFSTLVS